MQYFDVRGFVILLIAVLVAIAAGVGIEAANLATGPEAGFKSAMNSLDATPYLQMAISLDAPNAHGDAGEIRSGILTIDESSVDGATPLSASRAEDVQISFADEGSNLVDIRAVHGGRLYFRVFLSALTKLPSFPAADKSSFGQAGALLDGTWFSIPSSFISGLEKERGLSSGAAAPSADKVSSAEEAKIQAADRRFRADLSEILHFSSSSVAAGTAIIATASISSLANVTLRDLGPVITELLPSDAGVIANAQKSISKVSGRFSAQVITDGSGSMRTATVSISSKNKSAALRATIEHQPLNLGVPSGARSLPPTIINAIEQALAVRLIA
jgi:hypothetical protein